MLNRNMPGTRCIVCKATRITDPGVSFYRFPADETGRNRWISNLQLDADVVTPHSRVCSRHFRDSDVTKQPVLTLGKRFASPVKKSHPRAKRARTREMSKELSRLQRSTASPSSSRSVTPTSTPPVQPVLVASIGEQLQQDYHVHELPDSEEVTTPEPQ